MGNMQVGEGNQTQSLDFYDVNTGISSSGIFDCYNFYRQNNSKTTMLSYAYTWKKEIKKNMN